MVHAQEVACLNTEAAVAKDAAVDELRAELEASPIDLPTLRSVEQSSKVSCRFPLQAGHAEEVARLTAQAAAAKDTALGELRAELQARLDERGAELAATNDKLAAGAAYAAELDDSLEVRSEESSNNMTPIDPSTK